MYNVYGSVIPELLVNASDQDKKMNGSGGDDLTDNILMLNPSKIAMNTIDKFYDAGWAKNNSYYWYGAAPLGLKYPIKQNSFEVIRDCNLIIEKVTASTGINKADKPKLIAQGKMLRALMYYTKARKFGKYVIVDKVISDKEIAELSKNGDALKFPRTKTIKETYDFIIKDLQEAAVDLPVKANAKEGELTKGAAYAMLAEVALQGSAYIEKDQSSYWDIADKASKDLFALGYSLDSDYAGMFNNYSTAERSPELILTRYRHGDATTCSITPMQGFVPNLEANSTTGTPKMNESFLGWSNIWPTNNLVDDYLVADTDGKAKKWDQTTYFKNWKTNGGKIIPVLYKHRDARLDESIVRDSTMLFSNMVMTRIGGNLNPHESTKGTNRATRCGYFVRKGIYNVNGFKAITYTQYHHVIARLGRSYLNYAEVMLLKNNLPEAVKYINMTRTAHGKLPALVSSNKDEIWKAYKTERRVELFLENDRYWSLLRWGKFEHKKVISELNDVQYKTLEITADGEDYKIQDVYINKPATVKHFSERRYLYPVPQKEINLNGKYDQNPGW